MNLKSAQTHPHPRSLSWWHRLISLTSATLYSTVYTLAGTVLLGSMKTKVLANVAVGQTGGDPIIAVPTQGARAQIPVLPATEPQLIPVPPPTEPLDSTLYGPDLLNPQPAQLYEPVPPLGYPQPAPTVNSADEFNRYILGIGDAIAVSVERFSDLSFQATIDLQGNISVPLVGKLQVLGLTPEAVQDILTEKFNQFVVNPKVSVVLSGTRPATITITGEVVRPGYYSLAPGSQVISALQAAGGVTNIGDLRTVVVRRRSLDGNSIIERQVDLFNPLQNATALPDDLRLRDGDAVVVLKLETGTATDYDQTLIARSTLAQPQITIRILSYPNGRIGNINLPNGSTFIDALTSLAPSLEDSNLREISLMRFDPERGEVVTQEINGKRVLLGDVSQNVPLQDEDVIVVGRSLIAKVNYALRLVTRPFSDFLGFRNFFENLGDVFGSGSDNNSN